MNREQELVTVSTDVLGYAASPWEVQTLYQEAGFRCDLEIVAMPPQYSVICDHSRGFISDLDIGGIHGQLGSKDGFGKNWSDHFDRLKVFAADILLPKIMGWNKYFPPLPVGFRVEFIASILKKTVYYNVHRDIAGTDFDDFLDYGLWARKSHLTIENGATPNDLQKTKDLIRKYQDFGATRTTGTFDLVHAIKEKADRKIDFENVKKVWGPVLGKFSNDFKYLHLPIGCNTDSLPIMEMLSEKSMLKDLSAVIKEFDLHITIENQHGLLFGANKNKERERLKEIRSGLKQVGMNI